MPELPEVETIRRDLQRVLKGTRIARVEVRKRKLIRSNSRTFGRDLRGQVIDRIDRRGKLLIFVLKDEKRYLLVHLKMTGQLIYRDKKKTVAGGHGYPLVEQLPNKYSHIIIVFADKSRLYFNDMRQFGFMRLVNERELQEVLAAFGVEPLSRDFTVDRLQALLRGRRTALKNVLLNQSLIAGIGNIYVDEASFAAGVRPTRRADRVAKAEVKRLRGSIQSVLRRAITARGTTFGSYRDGLGGEGNFVHLLKVYGRAGERCKKCRRSRIKRVKLGGRGTAYCPTCQDRKSTRLNSSHIPLSRMPSSA